jgi:predicted membrane metal-binding protein
MSALLMLAAAPQVPVWAAGLVGLARQLAAQLVVATGVVGEQITQVSLAAVAALVGILETEEPGQIKDLLAVKEQVIMALAAAVLAVQAVARAVGLMSPVVVVGV